MHAHALDLVSTSNRTSIVFASGTWALVTTIIHSPELAPKLSKNFQPISNSATFSCFHPEGPQVLRY
jgi:hypothetical protein